MNHLRYWFTYLIRCFNLSHRYYQQTISIWKFSQWCQNYRKNDPPSHVKTTTPLSLSYGVAGIVWRIPRFLLREGNDEIQPNCFMFSMTLQIFHMFRWSQYIHYISSWLYLQHIYPWSVWSPFWDGWLNPTWVWKRAIAKFIGFVPINLPWTWRIPHLTYYPLFNQCIMDINKPIISIIHWLKPDIEPFSMFGSKSTLDSDGGRTFVTPCPSPPRNCHVLRSWPNAVHSMCALTTLRHWRWGPIALWSLGPIILEPWDVWDSPGRTWYDDVWCMDHMWWQFESGKMMMFRYSIFLDKPRWTKRWCHEQNHGMAE